MADEEELNEIANELRLYQARGEAIRQQMLQMQQTILEVGAAIEALANLKKAKGETLVPIGAGTYIFCSKPDYDRVLVNIGANLLAPKKPEEALKILEERQKKLTEAMQEAQKDLQQVVRAIEDLTGRANAVSQPEEKNVRPSEE
ncbi:MAG: prefoldin subunit alpha [Candidatus Micrarchaeota archaeon]|nr:prefoldin subunit alpha [Candidatus Micrarchaeota archaeon]